MSSLEFTLPVFPIFPITLSRTENILPVRHHGVRNTVKLVAENHLILIIDYFLYKTLLSFKVLGFNINCPTPIFHPTLHSLRGTFIMITINFNLAGIGYCYLCPALELTLPVVFSVPIPSQIGQNYDVLQKCH